ncbi:hypothetical protein ABIC63_002093 [Pseudacidovorax sp. 1753]|uniref:hypothetical protein n=1 Tax=Pseudacidovorax sp. 1753 TaxID=3156419 RepID=UPI003395507D
MEPVPGQHAQVHPAFAPVLAAMSGQPTRVPYPLTAANDEPPALPLTAEEEARATELADEIQRLEVRSRITDDLTRLIVAIDWRRAELMALNRRRLLAAGLDPVMSFAGLFANLPHEQ